MTTISNNPLQPVNPFLNGPIKPVVETPTKEPVLTTPPVLVEVPPNDVNAVETLTPTGGQMALITQQVPVNANLLRTAFPQCEGILDGEISSADIQTFGQVLSDLQTKVAPAEFENVLISLSQAVLGSKGQVSQLIQTMQTALPLPELDVSLSKAIQQETLTASETHIQGLLDKTATLMRSEISPSSVTSTNCMAAYGKLAAEQKSGLAQIDAELARLEKTLASSTPEVEAKLKPLQTQLLAARDILQMSLEITQCLSKHPTNTKDYQIDIRIPEYASVNDLSSQQLKDLQTMSQALKDKVAQCGENLPATMKAQANWTAQLAETVGTSLLDSEFRSASKTMKRDTNPAAVAWQYSAYQKLVENGEAKLEGKPFVHKEVGWYNPKFGKDTEGFIQVRLNGPKNMEILRSYVDDQLTALSKLSVDEIRTGKGDKLRAEIRDNLKSRLISNRSIDKFMAEIDKTLAEIKAAQPELTAADIKVPNAKPISRNEMAAFGSLYNQILDKSLKGSSDPMVKKYVAALELIQMQTGEGDASRYQENAMSEAKMLLDECANSPALKKIFDDARVLATVLMFDPKLSQNGKHVTLPNFASMQINPATTQRSQQRITELMNFIEGAALQGVDVSEQMSMLQALDPDKVQVVSKRILMHDAMDQIASKALDDPSQHSKIAQRFREVLVEQFKHNLGDSATHEQIEAFRSDLAGLSDKEMVTMAKTMKDDVGSLESVLKTFKKFSGKEHIHGHPTAQALVKMGSNERLGGALAMSGALLGIADEGVPKDWTKMAEDGAGLASAFGETFFTEKFAGKGTTKAFMGKFGMIENTAKMIDLFSKKEWAFKDYMSVTGGFAGIAKGGMEVVDGWQLAKNLTVNTVVDGESKLVSKSMSKFGGFYKCLGKVTGVVSVVLDTKAAMDASNRKDYVGMTTSLVQAGAGTVGFVAVCAGSGPLGWAALAVYGLAVGVDAMFGMSEEAEKVMDLRNDSGISAAMEKKYNDVATKTREVQHYSREGGSYTTTERTELDHSQILANVKTKPVSDRNDYRAAVIHMKLEEALTSDYDENLIKSLVDQAYQEGSGSFNQLVDKLGTRMLGYVSEQNDFLLDILDKMIETGASVEAGSKFHNLLVGLSENHNNEVVMDVMMKLKRSHPEVAAKVTPATLTEICNQFMDGHTDNDEEKAVYRLLNNFANDAQFAALIKTDEVSHFFKDLSSELEFSQSAELLVRAAKIDSKYNHTTQTAEHLFKMADFGLQGHSEGLRQAVSGELLAERGFNKTWSDPRMAKFDAWIDEKEVGTMEMVWNDMTTAFTPVVQRATDEQAEINAHKKYKNVEKLKTNKNEAIAGVRTDHAKVAARELAKLEASQITKDAPKLKAYLQQAYQYLNDPHRKSDPTLEKQLQFQLQRIQKIAPDLDLTKLEQLAQNQNKTESSNYDKFIHTVSGNVTVNAVKIIQADPILQSHLQRAW